MLTFILLCVCNESLSLSLYSLCSKRLHFNLSVAKDNPNILASQQFSTIHFSITWNACCTWGENVHLFAVCMCRWKQVLWNFHIGEIFCRSQFIRSDPIRHEGSHNTTNTEAHAVCVHRTNPIKFTLMAFECDFRLTIKYRCSIDITGI